MLANAAMGVEPEDAYYATRELLEAVRDVHLGEVNGKARFASILANDCDDFQRCLYYCLAGRGVVAMMDDLAWLQAKLETRARLSVKLDRMEIPVLPLSPAYLAACPDGPVPNADPNFREGPSWFLDPDLALLYRQSDDHDLAVAGQQPGHMRTSSCRIISAWSWALPFSTIL